MKDVELIREAKDLLVRRYIVALAVLATLISLAYFTLDVVVEHEESIAAELNLSGRQRMLSQRIALNAQNIATATTDAALKSFQADMRNTIAQFEEAHDALTIGSHKLGIPEPQSRVILDMYFKDTEWGLDAQVRSFIKLARTVNNTPGLTTDSSDFKKLWNMATVFLLPRLDEAVQTYQREGEKKIKTLGALQSAIWFVTMLVLVAEGFLIFRPMARQVGEILDYLLKAKQDLNAALTKAESANRLKSEFLANTSHELRTPLNAMIGISDILLEEAEEDKAEHLHEPLERINKASHHLLKLINDILDYSKLQADEIKLEAEQIDIAQLMDNLKSKALHLAEQHGNQMAFVDYEEAGTITGDMLRTRQIVFNLIDNACKFTHNGSISVSAKRQQDGENARVLITIKDTGIGIPADQIDDCFEVFTQMDASFKRAYEGAGMGLAISRQLARALGGDVTAESVVGKGSEFTLTLPVKPVQP